MFISFCGLDGCGKSTQALLLKEYFENINKMICFLIPGFRPSVNTQRLREISWNMSGNIQADFTPDVVSMSLLTDLWENTHRYIIPKLNGGETVITERYTESLLVYSPLFGSNVGLISKIAELFPVPDLYIYLEIDADLAYARVRERAADEFEKYSPKEDYEVMKKAAFGYDRFAKSNGNVITINVSELSVSQVNEKIICYVEEYSGKMAATLAGRS